MAYPEDPFVSFEELRAALGPATFLAIFDDDNDGTVSPNDVAVSLVRQRGHVEVLSYLPRIYDTLPTAVPLLLKSAELDYDIALSYERHPEYVRSFGEETRAERWLRAEKRMERVAEAVQQLTDHAPEPKPGILAPFLYSRAHRVLIDDPDGTDNGGDFG
ncbi:hypothetical protein LZC95_08015 [Pendulispora brunnea]|uniref:EF-hand domain-containing protein n=1 Tax=Pendulispora brunnea TaxID=2905690 RepID=A0ABZ2KDL6_9BACT